MINDLLRKFLSYLSLWYPNKDIPKKKGFFIKNGNSKKIK